MKLVIPTSLLVAVVTVAGCAAPQHALVLDPIGPPESQSVGAGSNGTLVVFSAFDSHADFNDLPYLRHYTDYRITRQDGKLVQTVHNDSGTPSDHPRKVQLPVGTYDVVARANGYGVVTVPVIIRANQVTTVHLEGGSAWWSRSQLKQSNPVRLPDGRIVGWRAGPDTSSNP
jgi:hypothetical protein